MNATYQRSGCFVFAAALMLSPCVLSAATKVNADKPKFEDLQSPDITMKGKNWKPKEWLELETKIKIHMDPAPKSKTCERITVKWYVAVNNPEKTGTFLKLVKEVEHVNIPLDEDVYCSVYLSPASIRRLTGSDHAGKSNTKYVGVEIIVDGQVVASESSVGSPAKWWAVPSPHVSDSDTVPLLNKSETPFAFSCWDRYAEVKAKTSATP